jgi:2C-methyl-D-erythritol 2,4-cyclodiphosphate synthase
MADKYTEEASKIRAHIKAMQEAIAEILKLDPPSKTQRVF